MKTWWDQRAPREQLLLLAAAIILALALFVQAVLIPSLKQRSAAEEALAESGRTLVRLERLREAGVTQAAPPTSPQDAPALAADWGARSGLVPDPALTSAPELRFAFKAADPGAVFQWIEEAETGLGITVQSAQISAAQPGQVDAVVAFCAPPVP
jgi:general secretion pathway protein M